MLALLDAGKLTSRELLEIYLARIERYNDSINAVIYLSIEEAREATDRADQARATGERWGPLHGLPFTVKDVHHVAGWPTTYGDPSEANYRPETGATIINRPRKAGAIIFGKTNVPLHSADFQTFSEIHGSTRNPWDLARSPGGSSGGAAAVLAAGFTSVEIGTDIAGSILYSAPLFTVTFSPPQTDYIEGYFHTAAEFGEVCVAMLGASLTGKKIPGKVRNYRQFMHFLFPPPAAAEKHE